MQAQEPYVESDERARRSALARRKFRPLSLLIASTVLVVVVAVVVRMQVQAQSRATMLATLSGRIAFASNRDGNYDIYVINADGSNETRLTTDVAEDTQAVWSRDGQKIAFTSKRDGNYNIYVM